VAQIQINERISLRHLVQWISEIWCFEDFCSSLYQLFYKLLIIWVFYSFLFPMFGLSNYIFGILYTLFTLVLLRHVEGVFYNCSFFILCLPFSLFRQKGGVFLVLDREYIFN